MGWFVHEGRREGSHAIQMAHCFSRTGKKSPGQAQEEWDNDVLQLMTARQLSEVDALNRDTWRSRIQGCPADSGRLRQGGSR